MRRLPESLSWGEAMNLVNAKYGIDPGLKAYSHVSDRYSPFATQTIPATLHEAPYILDGPLMNETGDACASSTPTRGASRTMSSRRARPSATHIDDLAASDDGLVGARVGNDEPRPYQGDAAP